MKRIIIYADGSSSGKVGPGGWGTIIIYPNDTEVVMSGSFLSSTNNQMEIWAFIEGLDYIEKHENINQVAVQVISDSEYLIKGANEWLNKWTTNGWKSKTGEVKNRPLWEAIHKYKSMMKIEFLWVKGHNNNEYNERVDKLAHAAYKKLKETLKGDKLDEGKSRKSKVRQQDDADHGRTD